MQSWSDVTKITSESAARNPRNLLQKISFRNSSSTPNNQSVVFSSGAGEFCWKGNKTVIEYIDIMVNLSCFSQTV